MNKHSPIEERTDAAGSKAAAAGARTVTIILVAISFSHLLNDTIQSLFPAIYPFLKDSFSLSYTQIGLITLTFQMTASFLQPIVGLYTDRRPKPYSLAAGMGCSLLGLVLLSLASSFAELLIAAALVGLGSAVFHPELSRVARMASGGRYGLAQSFFQVGGNVGSAIGPLAAAFVVIPGGQGSIAWFSLVALLAIVVLANVGRWYKGQIALHLRAGKAKLADWHGLSSRRVKISLAILLVLTFSKFFYHACLTSYYTFFLIEKFEVSVQASQIYLFIFLAAVAAGTFAGGPLGDRFGRKVVIWFSILGVLPFSILLPYADLFWTGVLTVAIGMILASAFSAIVVFAQELVPGRVGMIAGIFFGVAFGMGGLGAAALGWLADMTSIDTVFRICSFLPAIGLLTWFLPNIQRRTNHLTSVAAPPAARFVPPRERLIAAALTRLIRGGTLRVTFASGRTHEFGDSSEAPVAIRFADKRAERAVALDPALKVGELFMDGRLLVETGTVYDLISLIKRNGLRRIKAPHVALTALFRVAKAKAAAALLPEHAKRNVAHHYDLDAGLFGLFLDSDLQYSCAYFETPEQSLEEAQLAKKRHIAAKLLLEPGLRVLDIGGGWGGMALYLAATFGARVTGITLSEEQLAIARRRAAEGGVGDRVEFRLADYRDLAGLFDRIVSVGMFEHVGRRNYRAFFRKAASLLERENGVMLLHSIGRTRPTFLNQPFLEKYIFPGGYIPALSEVLPAVEAAGLLIKDLEILPLHYAWTLRAWRERFMANRDKAMALYDERFCRMWEFYLATSEAAFRHDRLFVFQLQLARHQDAVPTQRNYLFEAEAELLAMEEPASVRARAKHE